MYVYVYIIVYIVYISAFGAVTVKFRWHSCVNSYYPLVIEHSYGIYLFVDGFNHGPFPLFFMSMADYGPVSPIKKLLVDHGKVQGYLATHHRSEFTVNSKTRAHQ